MYAHLMRTCVHTAWASVLSVLHVRAIPEPQVAEQQDCSPAFFVVLRIVQPYKINKQ